MFASETPSTPVVYVSPQTVIVGLETIHLSNADSENISAPEQSAAIIYISANTVFNAPAEALRHAIVIHAKKIKSSVTKVIAKSETKKSVVSPKSIVREQKIPPPFRNTPNQNPQQFLSCGTASVIFFVDDDILIANIVAKLSSEFLKSIRQRRKVSFDEVAFLSLSANLEAHTTRPPPFC